MLKNVQIKIILILTAIGVIIISALGLENVYKMAIIEKSIENNEIQNISEMQDVINNQIIEGEISTIYGVVVFLIVALLVGYFVSKTIINPITKLIKSAEDVAKGNTGGINLVDEKKSKNEIDNLVESFSTITREFNDKLNEVTRQKRQIETILLHMTDGIIAFNMQGEIIHINPAATNLLKLNAKEDTFEKIFNKLDIDINMEKIIYLENWTSSEQKIKLQESYINLFFAPFKDENDRPAGVIVLIQDITEHVKLDNMRKEFVADVSHELKTPITSIMGYADTLLEGEYEKEIQDKFLGVISSEARRMARLVSDLLTLSKYDNKNSKWEKTEFDLGALAKQIQENLSLEIEKKDQSVECFVTANVPKVYADRDGIERVILNILTNSIKYTKEGGKIKIYVGFVYNDAYIKIIDNGIGIPEEDLERIFERFYRVDKARTREMGGTGLGLSIAKEILDQNNGSIDIKSKVSEGTEVVIRIPTKNN